jgi:surface polysaccharide O-acyltransferase-like enzyme
MLAIIIGTYLETRMMGAFTGAFYSYYCPFVAIIAVTLFVLFKIRNSHTPGWLLLINQASFGIYLIHPAVLLFLERTFNLNSTFIHPIIGIPVTSILTLLISTFSILLIQKVPFLKSIAP